MPAVTTAYHRAPDQRLAAALLGIGRVFDLLADRDLETLADEAREIGLVAMRRHAAHRHFFAVMLAAFGERDVERLDAATASSKNSSKKSPMR